MRPRIDAPAGMALSPHFGLASPAPADGLRDARAVAELFVGVFRRDVLNFFPRAGVEPAGAEDGPGFGGPVFRLVEPDGGADPDGEGAEAVEVEMFGTRYRLASRDGARFSSHDRRMVAAIGAVLGMRYYHLFQVSSTPRLELYRGGSDDHYVAAFVEPHVYAPPGLRPSRVAATVQTLRTAALSTYENHRVSTGALLLGPEGEAEPNVRPSPPDALAYGVELTALKSVHRLCDGQRTLFLVDRGGRLAEIIDIARWAGEAVEPEVPCPRVFEPHARATAKGGHVCLVLSPNQEIKLFAGGLQAFAFAHGRWRILDPSAKYAVWRRAVGESGLARSLFAAALNMAEARRGGLFVVADPARAVGRLIARHDLLCDEAPCGPPPELTPRDPLARRALHYLARGRNATDLDPVVLEALASLDGALATDPSGRLLAFGAILRQDGAGELPGLALVEGARTSAALVASLYGPVLKVSEDGIVSCFLDGARAWDL
jgi:hypothetical protein